MHFADAVVWMTIATLLATVHFSKAKDELGNEITPAPEYFGGGIVRYAQPYSSHCFYLIFGSGVSANWSSSLMLHASGPRAVPP
jgi:hypothetical protein